MIEIRKGNHSLNVSKNTYETMFKIMGYHIVGEEAKTIASSAKKNVLASKNKENKNIDAQKEHKDSLEGVFSKETSNLSVEEEKDEKNEPESKESNPDEGNNKLEDILGIISNNKKALENSKK